MRVLIGVLAILVLAACNTADDSPEAFSLPDGDPEVGQVVFVEMQCIRCHKLAGTELDVELDQRVISVELGGEATRVKTYAELVTSIINPSHKIAEGYPREKVSADGESLMPSYNDIMTVAELVDLVAFLHSYYELQSVPLTLYPSYNTE